MTKHLFQAFIRLQPVKNFFTGNALESRVKNKVFEKPFEAVLIKVGAFVMKNTRQTVYCLNQPFLPESVFFTGFPFLNSPSTITSLVFSYSFNAFSIFSSVSLRIFIPDLAFLFRISR